MQFIQCDVISSMYFCVRFLLKYTKMNQTELRWTAAIVGFYYLWNDERDVLFLRVASNQQKDQIPS